MKLMKTLATGVAAVALSTAFATIATPVMAQQTTSDIRGVVTDAAGAPLSGAAVTITDTRTGATRTTATDSNGSFSARNLTVGGPYSISAAREGYQSERLEGVQINLGASTVLSIDLDPATAAGADEIVVVGTRSSVAQLAIGPSSAFDQTTLEAFPSISRDIRDIIRIDPRVSLDRANEVDRISCLGGNDRSNTFTVDGVIQADVFGLNGTPFAARNSLPLPFDAISQTSVEFAPFDVQYGQFTGCNINVVTRSGSNEFHGSAFFDYASDGLQGKSLEGEKFEVASFDDYNWGATLGGPVIKDRIFFFVAYEETSDSDSQDDGPIGGGFANENVTGVPTLANVEAIQGVLESLYGIDTGGVARNLPQESRRILTRWDWLITDNHRLEFTYQRLRELNVESDDFGFSPTGFAFFNNFEEEGTKSETYSARLFSQWTDNFSTELRASRADVEDIQGPVSGNEAQTGMGTPRIVVGAGLDVNGNPATVISGPGQFRSANQLNSQVDQIKFKANYDKGIHSFSGGYELNQLDIFNLFIVNATGTLFFKDIDALIAGQLNTGFNTFPQFANVANGSSAGAFGSFSFTGDANDAAASFSRSIHALYAQDEIRPNEDLTLLLGLRYEFYTGDDTPLENQNFINRYGFTNAQDFSNLDAILPRAGFTWDSPFNIIGETQFRGGVGIFTGGDPTVWFSNAFSNSGNLNGFGALTSPLCTLPADSQVLNGGVFTGVPQCVIDAGSAQASLGLADTQSTDPDLDLATVIRSNLGLTLFTDFSGGAGGFFDDWRVDLDWIHSRFRNPYSFVDLSQTIDPSRGLSGFTVDGRPIYRAIDPTASGCTAMLEGGGGTPPTFTGVTPTCFFTGRDDEIQLTNTDGFSSQTFSAILSKSFDYAAPGAGAGSVRVNMGYAFTDSENRRDLTSSQSTSNFDGSALFDRQNPSVGTSGFETRHSANVALNFTQEFVKDYPTKLGIFFGARSGRPFSYTFDGSGDFNDSSSGSDNALLYVPTGIADPNISPFSDPAAVAGLEAYIADHSCLNADRGGTATRNGCRNGWFLDLDLRFQQALPVPGNFAEDRLLFFVDFDNFANLISDEANIFRAKSSNVDLVDVGVDSSGRYIITDFDPDDDEFIRTSASVWAIQFGIRYEF